MRRTVNAAVADWCDRCGAGVLHGGYDVLGDVWRTMIVDPHVLDRDAQIACIVAGRAMFRFEDRAFECYLGVKHPGTDGRLMSSPDAVLADHVCRKPMGTVPVPQFIRMLAVQHTYEDAPIPF